MSKRNYYDVVGVDPTASQEELRQSYLMRSRVLHPDRFDQVKQPKEWKKANEMLSELNEAYTVLRNPKTRAEYDAKFGYSSDNEDKRTQRSQSEDGFAQQDKKTSEPQKDEPVNQSRTKKKLLNTVNFEELPPDIKERLVDRQKSGAGKFEGQIKIQTEKYSISLVCILVPLLWMGLLLKLADNYKWPSETIAWYSIITIIASLLFFWGGKRLVFWHRSTLKPYVYFTPLHYIRTHNDEIKYGYLWDIVDCDIKHDSSNGAYSSSTCTMVFDNSLEIVTIKNQDIANQLINSLRTWEIRYKQAFKDNDWNYFVTRDDFAGIQGKPIDDKLASSFFSQLFLELKPLFRFSYGYLLALAVGLLWLFLAFNLNSYFDDKKSWESAKLFNTASSYRKYIDTHPEGRWKVEAQQQIGKLYEESARKYVKERDSKYENSASNSVIELLDYAKATGNYKVSVEFMRENKISPGIEETLKRKFGIANVIRIGNSFSDDNMKEREAYLLSTISSAFKQIIPEDILDFSSSSVQEKAPLFLVSYVVRVSGSLYFHDRDASIHPRMRPFYPGIFVDWNFEIRLPEKGKSYSFALKSDPASHFSSTDARVYDAMTESAFDGFRSEIVKRLGLHSTK